MAKYNVYLRTSSYATAEVEAENEEEAKELVLTGDLTNLHWSSGQEVDVDEVVEQMEVQD